MGLRNNDPKGTAVDDQAEGQYWVINGLHYNNGCCFDYGNAETDSRETATARWRRRTTATPRLVPRAAARAVDHDGPGEQLVGCVNPGAESIKLCAICRASRGDS
jgi:hypothetical protein